MGQGTGTDRHPELGRSQLALSEVGCRAADHGAALGKHPLTPGQVVMEVHWLHP